MDGLIYVISQLGLALSKANERIAQLEQEKAQLIAQSQEPTQPSE